MEIRRDDGAHLLQNRDPLQVDRGGPPRLAEVGLAQCMHRALELVGERRRVEKM